MAGESLDAALAEYDEPIESLVEDLLEEYFTGEQADISLSAQAVRRRRLKRQIDSLKSRRLEISRTIDDLEQELEMLDRLVSGEEDEELLQDALHKCRNIPDEKREPSNEAIQKHAKRVAIPPERFVDLLDTEYPTNRFGRYEGE